jgi:hypothetical protein
MRDGLPVLGRIALLATLLFTAQSVVLHAQSAIPLASNDAWLTELQRGQELDRQGKVAETEQALVQALHYAESFGAKNVRVGADLNTLALHYH